MKWEYTYHKLMYKVEKGGDLDLKKMMKLGKEGWELVSVDYRGLAFFKRPMGE